MTMFGNPLIFSTNISNSNLFNVNFILQEVWLQLIIWYISNQWGQYPSFLLTFQFLCTLLQKYHPINQTMID